MLAKAAVLCGKNTIQVRELELPPIWDDELLVKNISNSICLSTYKAALLGEDHKRVPDNISERPPITGHEFTGIIMEVGNHLKDRFQPGEKFVLQPAMGIPSGYSAGYSYEYFGGNATYCIIPKIAIDLGCVLPYQGNYFANASLSEPMSCIIGAYHATYHTKQYVYEHFMGVKEQGKLALMGCAGPMGIGAIDYAVNGPVSSKLIVVTDIDEQRLERARTLIPEEAAKKQGKTLIYAVNDDHADMIVSILKDIYTEYGVDNDAIMKITGSVANGNKKKIQEAIKRFKNEDYPSIVVTVDLLTTGIDVPSISTLVFMRRVKSRILFEQMLGRATRLCKEIHKTHFDIYDPVGVYDGLEDVNTMKPVVANPSTSFTQLLDGLEEMDDEAHVKNQIN